MNKSKLSFVFSKMIVRIANAKLHVFNVSSSILFKVLGLLSYFVSVPFFIKVHGDEIYGYVALIITLVTHSALIDKGVTYSFHLEYSKAVTKGGRRKNIPIYRFLPIYVLLSLLSFFVLIAFRNDISRLVFGSEGFDNFIVLLSPVLALHVIASFTDAILRAYNEIHKVNISKFVLDILRACSIVISVVFDDPIIVIIAFFTIAITIRIAVDLLFISNIMNLRDVLKCRISGKVVRLLRPSLNVSLIAVMSLFMLTYEKAFISNKISISELSYYSIAHDISNKAYFIFYAITASLYTPLIRLFEQGKNMFQMNVVIWICLFVFCVVYYLPISMFSAEILALYVNEEFSNHAKDVLPVLAIASIFYLSFSIVETNLFAKGESGLIVVPYVLGVIALVVSTNLFIEISIVNVAKCMLATYLVMFLSMIAVSRFAGAKDV